jgi:hypothetical protein
MSKRILLVGHCGVDGPRLQTEIASFLSEAEVLRINSEAELKRECEDGAHLLLINRELLGFTPRLGIDLVRELSQRYPGQKLILVSDYDDAQQEAQGAGALPGFGKADIGSPKFQDTIRRAVED